MSAKRLQLFIDEGVHSKFQEYLRDKYGPNARNISSVVQGLILKELREQGYWGAEKKWQPEERG